jgi:predicted dehydrogenase
MSDRFRLAVIGTGQITRAAHIPAALGSSKVELTAVVDSSPSRAEQTVRDFRLAAHVAARISEVRGDVDGALIATPNDTHCRLAVECLELGLPVLIEKPLATTIADGQAIVDAARRHSITAAVGYCTRFWENVRILGELLESKYFGAVRRFAYQLGMSDWAPPLTLYSFNRTAAGGGVLIVNGSHFLDRMLHWFGFPDEFEYRDDALDGPEANAVAGLRWTRNADLFGTLRLSKSMPLANGLVLDTEAGIVSLREDPLAHLMLRPHDRLLRLQIDRAAGEGVDGPASFRLQLEDFADACRRQRSPLVTAEEGLASLRLIDALYACRQPLDDTRPAPLEEALVP